jgi:hypothetical protein
MPEFMVTKGWHKLLHDRTRQYIENQLLKHKHIVVATMPYQLHDDIKVGQIGKIKKERARL